MSKTTLKKEELVALKQASKVVSSELINQMIEKKDDRYVFKALVQTPTFRGGILDVFEKNLALRGSKYQIAEFTLISPADFDKEPVISAQEVKAAAPIDKKMKGLSAYFAADTGLMNSDAGGGDAAVAELPSVIDRRGSQSPVKNQGSVRGTCVAHASMGLLEAFPHINDDLSEQYTHFKFMNYEGKAQNTNSGIMTTDAAKYLSKSDGRICLESEWPYISSQNTINAMVAAHTYAPPQAAVNNQSFGIGAYKIITDKGLVGESIKNTRYLEALIYQGYNIVFGVHASWDDKDNNGVLDPLLNPNGTPASTSGHAMMIVGYDRNNQYFIVKNSWGAGWGHSGYGYFSYNFIRACAKYGFVLDTVVPAAAPNPLPSKLVNAPYGVAKISRTDLRSAIVFFKTSAGRYAIAEAYAGDNLSLRNLKVYNANGSVHLTKSSLIIRSSYLCDLDTGAETSNNADFWWEGVRPGVHNLVPRNGAKACIAFNFGNVTGASINALSMTTTSIASSLLSYAVVLGKTSTGKAFKMIVNAMAGNKLQLSILEVYNADGSRYKYAQDVQIPSSWTYDLDALALSGGANADIWWQVISSNVGFLNRNGTAKLRIHWTL